MPRPMTTYRSGIRRVSRTGTKDCAGCGKPQTRTFTAEGVEPEADIARWLERMWWCIPCWRKAGRPG